MGDRGEREGQGKVGKGEEKASGERREKDKQMRERSCGKLKKTKNGRVKFKKYEMREIYKVNQLIDARLME